MFGSRTSQFFRVNRRSRIFEWSIRETHYHVKRLNGVPTTRYVEKKVRTSPWKLNIICRMIRRLWVPEALTQLKFVQKRWAPTVAKTIEKAAYKAGLQHNLVPQELEVERAFVTPAPFEKRLDIKAKGQSGIIRLRSGHIVIWVAKINFDKYIQEAKTIKHKLKWQKRREDANKERVRVLGEFAFTGPPSKDSKSLSDDSVDSSSSTSSTESTANKSTSSSSSSYYS
mmetsp:Transcript_4641/g.6995  ORF Transcript_4641/g.6995 Transcript_4641/m.6995 type:complete len:227 (-) Transcript_4641:660-1340(-)